MVVEQYSQQASPPWVHWVIVQHPETTMTQTDLNVHAQRRSGWTRAQWLLKFACALYLLLVPGDPRVQQQAQSGAVELLRGLHRDEHVVGGDVLGRGRRRGRGRARGPHRLPPAARQLGEVRGEARLRLRARGLVRARHLVHLDAAQLHGEHEQQQTQGCCAGRGDRCLLRVVLQHDEKPIKQLNTTRDYDAAGGLRYKVHTVGLNPREHRSRDVRSVGLHSWEQNKRIDRRRNI